MCTGDAALDALTKTRVIRHRLNSLPTVARADPSVVRLAGFVGCLRALLSEEGAS